jgi:hypothetical protein
MLVLSVNGGLLFVEVGHFLVFLAAILFIILSSLPVALFISSNYLERAAVAFINVWV